jgi:hypothetical protein
MDMRLILTALDVIAEAEIVVQPKTPKPQVVTPI